VADADLNMLRHMVQGKLTDARIAVFRGKGSFLSEHELQICQADGSSEQIRGEKIIIATGSVPAELPCAPFDGHSILSSDQILKN
ncbi:hypothetical protein NL521_29075, partial [Klebsiella pneumoniae]|nr:hypothetical protein [Klebsiella pneumoniae]